VSSDVAHRTAFEDDTEVAASVRFHVEDLGRTAACSFIAMRRGERSRFNLFAPSAFSRQIATDRWSSSNLHQLVSASVAVDSGRSACAARGLWAPQCRRLFPDATRQAHTGTAKMKLKKEVTAMLKLRLISFAVLLLLAAGAHPQTATENTFGTGGYNTMHFNAKEMDTKGDNKITEDEMMTYVEKMWNSMANGKDSIPVKTATRDFAEGGVSVEATEMDTNHDGKITKQEYQAYFSNKFHAMKHPSDNTISVQEAAKAFGRGGPAPTSHQPTK
jgi:EF hand